MGRTGSGAKIVAESGRRRLVSRARFYFRMMVTVPKGGFARFCENRNDYERPTRTIRRPAFCGFRL